MKTKFKFIPAELIAERHSMPYGAQALACWQWFVRKLSSVGKSPPYEYINGTSSVNNHEPDPIMCEDFQSEAQRRVRELLLNAGECNGSGKFLARHCGITSWASLTKPIFINIPTWDEFPKSSWFTLRGRTFSKSLNTYHPKAKWVCRSGLQLSPGGDRWRLIAYYAYPHDDSSWHWDCCQLLGEPLDVFTQRADSELNSLLTPEDANDTRFRPHREKQWCDTHDHLQGLFRDPNIRLGDWEDDLTNVLRGIGGPSLVEGRFTLSRIRLQTLKRWARSDRKLKN